jgi:hypothetical protein
MPKCLKTVTHMSWCMIRYTFVFCACIHTSCTHTYVTTAKQNYVACNFILLSHQHSLPLTVYTIVQFSCMHVIPNHLHTTATATTIAVSFECAIVNSQLLFSQNQSYQQLHPAYPPLLHHSVFVYLTAAAVAAVGVVHCY